MAVESGDDTDEPGRGTAVRFRTAWSGDHDPDTAVPELLPTRLVRAAARVLGVDGAAVSVIQDDFRVPLGGSDDRASFAERLQFSQGEGPCLDAARTGRFASAGTGEIMRRWPLFGAQLFDNTDFRGVLSLPLRIAHRLSGALDIYVHDERLLRSLTAVDLLVVADQLTAALSAAELDDPDADPDPSVLPLPAWLRNPGALNRTRVWIAMGAVMAHSNVAAPDALALLRSYAFGRDVTVDDLAERLVAGTLDPSVLDASDPIAP